MGLTERWTRHLRYSRESSFGSAVAYAGTSARVIDVASFDVVSHPARTEVQSERMSTPDRVFERGTLAEGSAELLPDFVGTSHWFAHMLGTPTTTNPAAGAYVHTWYDDPGYVPWSLVLDSYPDISTARFPGAFAKGCRLRTDGPDMFQLSVRLTSLAEREPVDLIPLVDEALFPVPLSSGPPSNVSFSLALAIDGVGGYPGHGTLVSDLSWGRSPRAGERDPEPIGIQTNGTVAVFGALRWYFKSTTIERHRAFRDLKKFGLVATWTGDQIGSTGVYRSISLDFPNCWIPQDSGPRIQGRGSPGSLDLETSFRALYDPTYQGPFKVTVTNTIASPALLQV